MVGGVTFPAVEVDLRTSLWEECPRGIDTSGLLGLTGVVTSPFLRSVLALSSRVVRAGSTDRYKPKPLPRRAPAPHALPLRTPVPLPQIPPSSSLPGGDLLQEASWDPPAAIGSSLGLRQPALPLSLSCAPSEAQTQSCSHRGPDLNPSCVPGCLRHPGKKMPTCRSLGGRCTMTAMGPQELRGPPTALPCGQAHSHCSRSRSLLISGQGAGLELWAV